MASPKGGHPVPVSPLAQPAADYKEPALRQYLCGHRGAPVSMGTPDKGRSSGGGVATEVEDMAFVDGGMIEIAGAYPGMEAATGALHRGTSITSQFFIFMRFQESTKPRQEDARQDGRTPQGLVRPLQAHS